MRINIERKFCKKVPLKLPSKHFLLFFRGCFLFSPKLAAELLESISESDTKASLLLLGEGLHVVTFDGVGGTSICSVRYICLLQMRYTDVRYVRCAHVNAKSHNLTKRAARKKAFSKGEKVPRYEADEDVLNINNIVVLF